MSVHEPSATAKRSTYRALRSIAGRSIRWKAALGRRMRSRLEFAWASLRVRGQLAAVERQIGLGAEAMFLAEAVHLSRRGREALVHVATSPAAGPVSSSLRIADFVAGAGSGALERLTLVVNDGSTARTIRADGLLDVARRVPGPLATWLSGKSAEPPLERPLPDPETTTGLALQQLSALDFLAATDPTPGTVFSEPDELPPFAFAEPRKRSVLFMNNAYFYFEILADALRRRGWEAHTVSFEPPDSPSRRFYWNRDEIIYDADPAAHRAKVSAFFRSAVERFGTVHFHGQYQMSFHRDQWTFGGAKRIPWDFLELKRRGIVIGYTPSGCLDGARQSSIRAASSGLCGKCVWELEPNVCSDALNGGWARQITQVCDWIGLENDYAVDERTGPRYVRQPVVSALDPTIWRPGLEIPHEHRIERAEGEVIVFHGFANSDIRRTRGRDIKGSGALVSAVDRLKGEGLPIRLFMAKDIPIDAVRYYQSQCDIVVEQLNYGRIGSTARESLMLGRPVVTRIEPRQSDTDVPLESMAQAPVASADETTIEDVLRQLAQDPERRREMGVRARDYAMRWHSDDVCAARFETIVDRVRAGLPADLDRFPQA